MHHEQPNFSGAKVILFVGDQVLLLRRDRSPGIPWPGMLDFPGGGREDDESPQECACRETFEETGLQIMPDMLRLVHLRGAPPRADWFFSAAIDRTAEQRIVFGGEGTGWLLLPPTKAARHPDMIPHFAWILKKLLVER